MANILSGIRRKFVDLIKIDQEKTDSDAFARSWMIKNQQEQKRWFAVLLEPFVELKCTIPSVF